MNAIDTLPSTIAALPINTAWSGFAGISAKEFASRTRASSDIGEWVDNEVSRAFGFLLKSPTVAYLGPEYFDYLAPNWDGEGATPISPQTMENAYNFLTKIGNLDFSPEICPESDGYIQLEWYVSPQRVFSLSFGPSNQVAYSGIFGEGSTVYGSEKLCAGVPNSIWDHIERICGQDIPG